MRIMGLLEGVRGLSLQEKHVRGVENIIAGRITRWKKEEIQTTLTAECDTVSWQAQELGVNGTEICSEILHAATYPD